MKHLFFLTLVFCATACATTKKTTAPSYELNGTWIPERQEIGGKELPATFYQNQKLVISDTSYVLNAESEDRGTLSYKDGKMDIYGKEGVNKGKHFPAIYKLENNRLTICYNLAGDSYPTGFETKAAKTLFLSVFKKN